MDDAKAEAIAEKTREAGVWNTVTNVVVEKFVPVDEAERLMKLPEMRYISPVTLASWNPATDFRLKTMTAEDFDGLRRSHEARRRLTGILHRSGARILLGTDTPNPFVVPGFSIHEELQRLVDSGLTPYEALRAGTSSAFEYLDEQLALDERFGTVAVGARADLILLEANPLDDVANVVRRVGVMVRGQWLPEDELQRMLEAVRDSYRVPEEPFAGMDELPGAAWTASYDIGFGPAMGVERYSLTSHGGRTVVLAQQATFFPPRTSLTMRMELDEEGTLSSMNIHGEVPEGDVDLELRRDGELVLLSGTAGRARVDIQETVGPETYIHGPLMATAFRLAPLEDRTELHVLELELFPEPRLVNATWSVKKQPGETVGHVYSIDVSKPNASYPVELMLNNEGDFVTVAVEQQMGILTYRRRN